MTTYRDFYGRYSLGSGAILPNQDKVWERFADPEIVAAYKKSIFRDLVKSGVSLDEIKEWTIMDVGTGRQALALLELGAKAVDHFDISPGNVEKVKQYIAQENISDRLSSTCCDIVETDIHREKYNFIYLNGIVQHFSNVGVGIEKCMAALKNGGLLWLYFYRSGTFENFVLFMIRDIIHYSNIATDIQKMKEHYLSSLLFFSRSGVRKDYLSSIYMDGAFTRFANLYTLQDYVGFVKNRGFEIVSSSGIDPVGRDIDHYYSRAATVLTLRKIKDRVAYDSIENNLCPDKAIYPVSTIMLRKLRIRIQFVHHIKLDYFGKLRAALLRQQASHGSLSAANVQRAQRTDINALPRKDVHECPVQINIFHESFITQPLPSPWPGRARRQQISSITLAMQIIITFNKRDLIAKRRQKIFH